MSGFERLCSRLIGRLAVRVPRSMREFAEAEILMPPGGPAGGMKFDSKSQPWMAAAWDVFQGIVASCELRVASKDSSSLATRNSQPATAFQRMAAVGPGQSGKSFGFLGVPIVYHLVELVERVILGVPGMDMAADKIADDVLPIMAASPVMARLIPKRGSGSKGGKISTIRFDGGQELRSMSAGGGRGGDKRRAGKTARVVAMTEVDGMDEASSTSREADPVTQIEARTNAHGPRRRIYLECTASIEEGRIWQEYLHGTRSRLEITCPHCLAWVTPEREHLQGWQGAANEVEAGEKAGIVCPACAVMWTEGERKLANQTCRWVHQNDHPSFTFSLRWTAVNNCLVPIAETARKEWKAARDEDDGLERELLQFHWALPAKAERVDLTATNYETIMGRQLAGVKRGMVPAGCRFITVGCDMGMYLCHWTGLAWMEDGTTHVLDYGVFEVNTKELGVEVALTLALRDFSETVLRKGWDGRTPVRAFYDCGAWQPVITAIAGEYPGLVFACKGFGERQVRRGRMLDQQGWEAVKLPGGVVIVELMADWWKSLVHAGFSLPIGRAGGWSLFSGSHPRDHLGFAKHNTAEKKVEIFVAGKGVVTVWEMVGGPRRPNHWGDSTALAGAAGRTYEAEGGESESGSHAEARSSQRGEAAAGADWVSGHKGKW